jgi:hypothetical protein
VENRVDFLLLTFVNKFWNVKIGNFEFFSIFNLIYEGYFLSTKCCAASNLYGSRGLRAGNGLPEGFTWISPLLCPLKIKILSYLNNGPVIRWLETFPSLEWAPLLWKLRRIFRLCTFRKLPRCFGALVLIDGWIRFSSLNLDSNGLRGKWALHRSFWRISLQIRFNRCFFSLFSQGQFGPPLIFRTQW